MTSTNSEAQELCAAAVDASRCNRLCSIPCVNTAFSSIQLVSKMAPKSPLVKYFPSRCNSNKKQPTAMPGSGAQVLAGSTATILASAAVHVNGACLALLLLWRQAQELKHTLVTDVILHRLCPLAQRKHLYRVAQGEVGRRWEGRCGVVSSKDCLVRTQTVVCEAGL